MQFLSKPLTIEPVGGSKAHPWENELLWCGATSKAAQTYLRQKQAVGPRDIVFIPSQQLFHYLVLLYLCLIIFPSPQTTVSNSNLSPHLYNLPVPPTTLPVSLGPCCSHRCLSPINLQYPEHPGCPALPFKRLFPLKPGTLWAI